MLFGGRRRISAVRIEPSLAARQSNCRDSSSANRNGGLRMTWPTSDSNWCLFRGPALENFDVAVDQGYSCGGDAGNAGGLAEGEGPNLS